MKAPLNLQRFSCTLEIVVMPNGVDTSESLIRVKADSGQELLSLSIAPELGQHIASAHTYANASINIDGSVSVMSANEFQPRDQTAAVSLDQLVADAVSTDMLEDEPEAATLLAEFRIRLLKSLDYVDQAIASLAKD